MSFEKLYYKGKEVLPSKIPGGTGVAYFDHIYRTTFRLDEKDEEKIHACLRHGYWCWKNFLERPKDILPFFRGKIK